MPMSFRRLPMLAALPDADAIRRKAAEVVARPEFELDSGIDAEQLNLWWRILMWLLTPVRWFFELLGDLPESLRWLVVIGLLSVLLALVGHIIWTFVRAIQGTPMKRFGSINRDRFASPEELEASAEGRAAEGDLIGAIRCLFRACLLRIERAEEKPFRRGITNREILRRYRTSPLFEPLSRLVETIDTRWYGHAPCEEGDYLDCRTEHARIRSLVERQAHAVRA